jgi:hypothetical protein
MLTATTVPAWSATLCAPQRTPRLRDFDLVVAPRFGRTVARRARLGEIGATLVTASAAIDRMRSATREVVARVVAHNPDSLWVFVRDGLLVGCSAMMMLNEKGLSALLAGEIDMRDPAPAYLTAAGDRPAAIYVWALASPSVAADGIAKIIMRLQSPPYERADLYASPATRAGLRFMRALGFEPIPGHPRNLFRYIRLVNRQHQLGD